MSKKHLTVKPHIFTFYHIFSRVFFLLIFPFLKTAGGIITEEGGLTSHAAIVAMALDKPVIIGAKNATKLLKTGTTVKLDCSRGLVFNATGTNGPSNC